MENLKEAKKILTPEEVAKELYVSRNLIYRQLRKKTIPSVKCGDRYLISRVALEKWLAGDIQTAHSNDKI